MTTDVDPAARIARHRLDSGLPVSSEIVSAVLAKNARDGRNGSYTDAEEQDIFRDHERRDKAQAVLAHAENVLSSIEVCWLNGQRAVRVWLTAEHDRYRDLLTGALGPDRVLVEQTRYTARESREFHERVRADSSELAEQGIYLSSFGPTRDGVDVAYYAADFVLADKLLHDRYGAFAHIRYEGASPYTIRDHPFGSWHDAGNQLHLFYALPHNGEQPGSATAVERNGSLIVSLTIVDWRGAKHLKGGFTPSHLTIDLSEPLGNRQVIDNCENRARPHWTKVPTFPRRPGR